MSYNAKVYNVMIASPGDVDGERAAIRSSVYEWNVVHSELRGIVLLPVGWETHSSPEMGATPQEIINTQVLKDCDLLVAVFWSKLGTETKEYLSGTVEEIERHIKADKPAMIYFSNKPIAPNELDFEQLKKLNEFKESCQKRGLYEEFSTVQEFKEKFYRHLQLKVNSHKLFAIDNGENLDIIETKTAMPSITETAKILLKHMSQDPSGNLLKIRTLSGTTIQANGKALISSKDRREVAKWESAVDELIYNELIIARGYKGEIFEITNKGYDLADMLDL